MVGVLPVPGVCSDREVSVSACLPSVVCLRAVCGVSLDDGQNHKTVFTNHNLFEEKGEPKRYRNEVLPLTSLTPYR